MQPWQEVLDRAGFPIEAVVLDFESYFDKDYTLKKMSTIEYVTDERFVVTGLGSQFSHEDHAEFLAPFQIKDFFRVLKNRFGDRDLSKITVVCLNVNFDCLIMRHHFDTTPKYIVDLMDLDKMWDARSRHSMVAMVEKWDAPTVKGDTDQFKGKHYHEMSPGKRERLAEYTINDAEIETWLLKKLLPITVSRPEVELPVANLTHQMYLQPSFQIDSNLGEQIIEGMRTEMQKPLDRLKRRGVKAAPEKTFAKTINSNICFARLLLDALPEGETVPVKPGKPTKNMKPLTGPGLIPAFAKDDEGMYRLLHHPKLQVRRLAEAKQSLQSWPLHIAKVANIMRQAVCQGGFIGTPLGYHSAHTARWAGTEKINLQNLGGRGRGGKGTHPLIQQVRHMLRAPKGYVLGIQDYSKVEAVGVAWQADQRDLLEGFRSGLDVYSDLATELFGHPVHKPKGGESPEEVARLEVERGFGKDAILGCLAKGTRVLAANGWTSIEDITTEWGVWDGTQWVLHDGVADRGEKLCIKVRGVWLTPEHEVLTRGGWTTAVELSMNNRESTRNTGNSRLPIYLEDLTAGLSPSNAVAPAVKRLLLQETILYPGSLNAVMSVLKRHPAKLRVMKRSLASPNGHAFLTEFVQSLVDVRPGHIDDMVLEVSECGPIGSMIESLFLNTWRRWKGSMIHDLKLTGSITIVDTSLVISDSLLDSNKLETRNVTCYDILNAGPDKRFQAGDIMCSNCGYGMGASTFYDRCYANEELRPKFDDGTFGVTFIENVIKTYRRKYNKIPTYWQKLEQAWRWVTKYPGERKKQPECKLEFFNEDGATFIRLPSGRLQRYPFASVKRSSGQCKYYWGPLWGGTLTENVVSSLCRDFIAESMLRLQTEGFWCVLTVHDEIVTFLPEAHAEGQLKEMGEIMTAVPSWARGFPLQVESKLSEYYCK